MSQPPAPTLSREAGLPSLIAIAVNGVVGSGIFVLPATVAALMGPSSPTAHVVAATVTAIIVLCFAEAGSRFDETGGPYIYAREAFGSFVGFEVGWMFFLSRLAAAAAIGNALVSYAAYFLPDLGAGFPRVALLTIVLGGFAAANVAGVRYGAAIVNVFTIAKLGPLLLFVAAGWWLTRPEAYRLFDLAHAAPLREASLLLIFAFGGFENAAVPAGEAKLPRRHVPIALVAAIALTAVLYVLIQIVAIAALPSIAESETPLASAAAAFLGAPGAAILTLGAVISTAGSVSALSLVGPRILYALGAGRQMPAALARVHPSFRTPHVAIVVFAACAWAVAIAGSFAELAAISAIARLVFSATTCLAVPVLRRRGDRPARFLLPGGPVIPLLGAAVAVWLLTAISARQAVAGLLAAGTGALLYLLFARPKA
ncbi:MAG TPA: amino acid permease [Vicinamibacterales bacterium]|nr:amino acid permease [Vicinamibacterales bacterium]